MVDRLWRGVSAGAGAQERGEVVHMFLCIIFKKCRDAEVVV